MPDDCQMLADRYDAAYERGQPSDLLAECPECGGLVPRYEFLDMDECYDCTYEAEHGKPDSERDEDW